MTKISDTNWFSAISRDYLFGNLKVPFPYQADMTSIQKHIAVRKSQYSTEIRSTVATVLTDQGNPQHLVQKFQQESTVCTITAHQPIVGLGPSYMITKAISALKLAKQIEESGTQCVAVYWLGSEDHDIDELGTVNFGGQKFKWAEQPGVIGRYSTETLATIGDEIRAGLGSTEAIEKIIRKFEQYYTAENTFGKATQQLLLDLFSEYDLLVIDPDQADLKAIAAPIWEKEIQNQASFHALTQIEDTYIQNGYAFQAKGRELNFFLLEEMKRLRPELVGEKVNLIDVATSEITAEYSKEKFAELIVQQPHLVSPNVILRPLYQEILFPNVAFVGGAGELSYWLQFPTVFAEFEIPIPPLVLRDIVFQYPEKASTQLLALLDKINDHKNLILPIKELEAMLFNEQFSAEIHKLENLAVETVAKAQYLQKFVAEHYSGEGGVHYHYKRIEEHIHKLQKKMKRHWKQQEQSKFDQLHSAYTQLFPGGGLRERKNSFFEFSVSQNDLIATYFNQFDPLSQTIVEHKL